MTICANGCLQPLDHPNITHGPESQPLGQPRQHCTWARGHPAVINGEFPSVRVPFLAGPTCSPDAHHHPSATTTATA